MLAGIAGLPGTKQEGGAFRYPPASDSPPPCAQPALGGPPPPTLGGEGALP